MNIIRLIACPAEGWTVELLPNDLIKLTLIDEEGRPQSRTFPRALAAQIAVGLLERELLSTAPAANAPERAI